MAWLREFIDESSNLYDFFAGFSSGISATLPPFVWIAVIVNSLGRTSEEELFVLYKDVAEQLEHAHLTVIDTHVGRYTTSLDMDGCSLSVIWLDDELKTLMAAPADCPAYVRK